MHTLVMVPAMINVVRPMALTAEQHWAPHRVAERDLMWPA
jgi:hypothetical protein